jgi:hypothetical protein
MAGLRLLFFAPLGGAVLRAAQGSGRSLPPVPFGLPSTDPPRNESGPGKSKPPGYLPGAPGFLTLSHEKKSLFAACDHFFSPSLHKSRSVPARDAVERTDPRTSRERPGSSLFPMKKNHCLRHVTISLVRPSTSPAAYPPGTPWRGRTPVPAGSAAAHNILFL